MEYRKFRLKSKQDIEDFLTGCAFYGTGGGGNTAAGRASLTRCLEQGYDITLMRPEEIDDDALYCSVFFMGSIAPKTEEVLREMERGGYTERKYVLEDILIGAVRSLEQFLGRKVSGLVIVEPGGSNAACCMAAGYKMDMPVLDGDPVGRAVPEMMQGPLAMQGKNCLPAVYFDSWGNSNVTIEASGYPAMERIGKFLSQASYGEMAEAGYVLEGREVRKILIPNTLSRAWRVGQAINRAAEEGRDPLAAAAEASGGRVVAMGTLREVKTRDADGYYWGTYIIEGEGAYAGNAYKVWFKNENHILWINDAPAVTSPDLITLLNAKTGAPILNTFLKEGERVGIVTNPSDPFYMCDKAVEVFGPRAFGFDFDYVPYPKD
ncbi:MAG TPA: DUF917 domain-containing protein [Clostridia bacterium]|nr:DUF917 domain-containing protein [Clostridia bacterium]